MDWKVIVVRREHMKEDTIVVMVFLSSFIFLATPTSKTRRCELLAIKSVC